jgi:hypothetical protein
LGTYFKKFSVRAALELALTKGYRFMGGKKFPGTLSLCHQFIKILAGPPVLPVLEFPPGLGN